MRRELARIAADLARALRHEQELPGGRAILVPSNHPEKAPAGKTLARVAAEVRACTRCPLGKTRKNAVPGEGSDHPILLLVGEAPGAEEDHQGRPFVGRAGRMLTNMLAAINIEREEVFIANVLKCRPPGNRDPNPAEVAACRPHLAAQIAALEPRVVVTLGRFASQLLLDTTTGITRLRGTPHRWQYEGEEAILLPTLHPSYLLRNPAAKRDAWEDMKHVHAVLREITGDWPPPLDPAKVARMSRAKRGARGS